MLLLLYNLRLSAWGACNSANGHCMCTACAPFSLDFDGWILWPSLQLGFYALATYGGMLFGNQAIWGGGGIIER